MLGRDLRGNASAATGNEAGEATQDVPLVENILHMGVAGHQEVQAKVLVELLVPVRLVSTLEVCGDKLPVGCRVLQLLLRPLLLTSPCVPHELEAGIQILGSACGSAVGSGRVVHGTADVVLGVSALRMGVHGVGVQHEDLNGELRILHPLHEVLAWHDPAVAGPSVGDLLVPGLVELEASIVVVPQDTEPGLSIHPGAMINILEDLTELVRRNGVDFMHRRSAVGVDASPVEIVANVDEEVWIAICRKLPHRICDVHLRSVVGIVLEVAI
mmetsp:Transcript_54165/g.75073  ORF Transcript_54165/g.75073 Transcript_54165/m.75073 type:complete len:271 (+) Transcript_54165:207-1019(+)